MNLLNSFIPYLFSYPSFRFAVFSKANLKDGYDRADTIKIPPHVYY